MAKQARRGSRASIRAVVGLFYTRRSEAKQAGKGLRASIRSEADLVDTYHR
jgi:hypothetical protein